MILQPPFPMREPHWLAGTTSRRVTGGRLAAVLLVMELLMSCEEEESLREGRGGARRGALAGIVPLTLAQEGQGDPRDLPAPITQE